MSKSIGKITLAGLLAAVVLGMPLRVSAQDDTNKPAASAPAPAPAPEVKRHKYSGKLVGVDKVAMSITVSNRGGKPNRVIYITSDTKIKRNGKEAILDDGVIGDKVTGSYTADADGKKLANTVYFSAKPEQPAEQPAPAADSSTSTNAPAK